MTTVVNLRREPYDIYIGRMGKPIDSRRTVERGYDGCFGNPLIVGTHGTRLVVIEKYRASFMRRIESDADFRSRVLALKDKRLGCFCKPLACHGDVIAEWIDSQEIAA